jgi:predicted Zn-dependent peptidase
MSSRDLPQTDGIRTSVLGSGLRLITERLPYVRSVALGINFTLGARDDPAGQGGLAHMVEHMVFKGTADRDAVAINAAAEFHGAELNAFTDKETTCFYGRFPGDQTDPVVALMSEIISGPAFRPEELVREKEVIAEEIRTAQEDPDSIATNLLFKSTYGEHPMGLAIAGTIDSVNSVGDGDLRTAYARRYGPACGVAVAVGEVEHERIADRLSRLLHGQVECDLPQRSSPAPRPPEVLAETKKELSQVYVCLAKPAMVFADPRRHALSILNAALGGGMSSRLFQRLREREALVYSVSSFTDLYSDSGMLGVYFVTGSRKLGRCCEVLREELARLRAGGLTAEEFERAKNMTKSSVLLALESSSARMMRLARTWQLLGRVVTVDETVGSLDRVTRVDVSELVGELLATGFPHAGAAGPLSEGEVGRAVEALNA